MKLYSIEAINDDDIEAELVPLQERKKAIKGSLENAKSAQGVFEVFDADIIEMIGIFIENIKYADPIKRKSAVRSLFQEFRTFPQKR